MGYKILGSVTNSTQSVAGLKQKAWMFNLEDATLTFANTNEISNIVNIGAARGYTAQGCKRFINGSTALSVAPNLCDSFTQSIMMDLTVGTAATQRVIDQAQWRLFIVVQREDGALLGFGAKYGLQKTEHAYTANDNKGMQNVAYGTPEGMEEPHSLYFVNMTPAQLDALI